MKTELMHLTKRFLSINPFLWILSVFVTLPASGAIVIAGIISFIAPPASGFNTIPRLAAEFVYEKSQNPATQNDHIVFFRCEDSTTEDALPKSIKCENLTKEEVPIDKVSTAFGNIAIIGYLFSMLTGLVMLGLYKALKPSIAALITFRRSFSR